jgi:hypothetical protein
MKRILLVILTISASLAFNSANAQNCGFVTPCLAGPGTQVGFPNPDSIPCIIQGQPYTYSIPFKMYDQFTFLGQHNIDSITFDTLFNLPCGMCYSLNKASATYDSAEIGCLRISGVTHDAVGQYSLNLAVTAYLSGDNGVGEPINPPLVYASGIKIWLRVAAAGGSCDTVYTSQADSAAKDLTAQQGCPLNTSVNEVAANVASVNIAPNPFNSSAQLSFTAEKNATYSVKITDITGKLVSVKQLQANPGVNTTDIERGNLSSGLYLLSLSDGVSSVTRKFTIVE